MFENYVGRISGASPGERRKLVFELSQRYGCSVDTVYRRLKKAGWKNDRKRRRDARLTQVCPEDLEALGALLKSGIRKNGKSVKDIPTARQELEAEGVCFGVSDARLAALLRDYGMDTKSQRSPRPYSHLRSLYPNHVHQVDPSMCLVYYLPSGRQKIIEEDEVYKNKPYLSGKGHLKVWRYVLTDHYSCSVCVRYYQRSGESMETLWDFLLYAWGKKTERNYLFHGVPEILYLDKGSANLGGGIVSGLESLRVKQISHTAGNPRAKGQVEKMNHLVEKLFESRLRTEPAGDLEELNRRAEFWCAAYNANGLEGCDSTLKRADRSRLELWSQIGQKELRELPQEAKELLRARPVSRRVGGDLCVSFVHPKIGTSRLYKVGGFEGVRPRMSVLVQPILMDAGGTILVRWEYQGEEYVREIGPGAERNEAGFLPDAPVIGEEFRSNADTAVDVAAKRLDELIGHGSRPFAAFNNGQGIGSFSHLKLKDAPLYIPRRGECIDVQSVSVVLMNAVEAGLRIKSRLGFFEPSWLSYIEERYPKGVGELDLEKLIDDLGVKDEFAGRVG